MTTLYFGPSRKRSREESCSTVSGTASFNSAEPPTLPKSEIGHEENKRVKYTTEKDQREQQLQETSPPQLKPLTKKNKKSSRFLSTIYKHIDKGDMDLLNCVEYQIDSENTILATKLPLDTRIDSRFINKIIDKIIFEKPKQWFNPFSESTYTRLRKQTPFYLISTTDTLLLLILLNHSPLKSIKNVDVKFIKVENSSLSYNTQSFSPKQGQQQFVFDNEISQEHNALINSCLDFGSNVLGNAIQWNEGTTPALIHPRLENEYEIVFAIRKINLSQTDDVKKIVSTILETPLTCIPVNPQENSGFRHPWWYERSSVSSELSLHFCLRIMPS